MAGTIGIPSIKGNNLVFNFDPTNGKSFQIGSSTVGVKSNLGTEYISTYTLDNGITFGNQYGSNYLQVNGATDTTSYLQFPWFYGTVLSHGLTVEVVYENLNDQSVVYPFNTGMSHGGPTWYDNGGWVTYPVTYNSNYNRFEWLRGGFGLCLSGDSGTLLGSSTYQGSLNEVSDDESGLNAIYNGLKYQCISFKDNGDNTVNVRTKAAMMEPESIEGAYYNLSNEFTIDYTGYYWGPYLTTTPLIRFGVDYPSIYSGHHRNSRWYSIRVYESMLSLDDMENNLNSFKKRFI